MESSSGHPRVRIQAELPEGMVLRVTVESPVGERLPEAPAVLITRSYSAVSQPTAPGEALALPPGRKLSPALSLPRLDWRALPRWIARSPAAALLAAALLVYGLVRFIALPAFPIYFFSDEAIQRILADDFVRDSFRNYGKEFLPTYFVNGGQYNLSVSVYLQVLPSLLTERSVWVTRGICALVSLLAGAALGLAALRVYKIRFPWLAVLFLSATPAWFLHSRTAFETSLAVTFFALFACCYLMYRAGSPRYLYWAVAMGALCFYAYSPAQVVMGVSALLLLISDWRYHWQNRRTVLRGLGLALLLALPYFRYLLAHPGENLHHMRLLGSYWVAEISFPEKLLRFGGEYLKGLNPFYWFLPNNTDLARHLMKGYGHVSILAAPFAAVGLGQALWRWRSPHQRAALMLLLAAPAGAATAQLGITRALFMVVPLALLSALGASAILDWLAGKRLWQVRLTAARLGAAAFVLLAGFNLLMLRDALVNGGAWFTDYGLYGMQWGGEQLHKEISAILKASPETKPILSPSWANGTDTILRFFFGDKPAVELGTIDEYIERYKPLPEQALFICTPEEYGRISPQKFTDIRLERTLAYPDGRPGFYFVRLRYVDDVEAVFAAEREARARLEEETLEIGGVMARVRYSRLDMGKIQALFDGNPFTVMRSLEANPFRLQVEFERSIPFQGVTLLIGATATNATLQVWLPEASTPLVVEGVMKEGSNTREFPLNLQTPVQAAGFWLDVKNTYDPTLAHVHLWDLKINAPSGNAYAPQPSR